METNMTTEEHEKTLHMTVLMTPDMANFSGNVHGGSILKMLDQVAYAILNRGLARSWPDEVQQHANGGGLTCPVGSQVPKYLAGLDLQVQIRHAQLLAVIFGDAIQADHSLHAFPLAVGCGDLFSPVAGSE